MLFIHAKDSRTNPSQGLELEFGTKFPSCLNQTKKIIKKQLKTILLQLTWSDFVNKKHLIDEAVKLAVAFFEYGKIRSEIFRWSMIDDLSQKIHKTIQPVFVSQKINQHDGSYINAWTNLFFYWQVFPWQTFFDTDRSHYEFYDTQKNATASLTASSMRCFLLMNSDQVSMTNVTQFVRKFFFLQKIFKNQEFQTVFGSTFPYSDIHLQ